MSIISREKSSIARGNPVRRLVTEQRILKPQPRFEPSPVSKRNRARDIGGGTRYHNRGSLTFQKDTEFNLGPRSNTL